MELSDLKQAHGAGDAPLRVQLHPGTDAWMRGDKYGTVLRVGKRFVHVKMDTSHRTLRVVPGNILEIV